MAITTLVEGKRLLRNLIGLRKARIGELRQERKRLLHEINLIKIHVDRMRRELKAIPNA